MNPEWGLVYLTLALVVVTGCLAIYTAKLWGATKSLAEDAKRTSERQSGEVRESLRIGRETIEAMERHSERRLRAYVFVESAEIRDPYSERGGQVKITFKNFGATPA